MSRYSKEDLTALRPKRDSFVGIDSDGCVFDTMSVKQKTHFHPLIIKHWGLEAVEAAVRDVAEYVNLRSKHRGSNRFPALLMTFEALAEQPAVAASGARLPDVADLRAYCQSGVPLGNETLAEAVGMTGSEELEKVLNWSLEVNADIAANMALAAPFPGAREAIEMMGVKSDLMVVSQTPEETLLREWDNNGMDGLVRMIAGQELGSKTEQMGLAAGGKYKRERTLLIGDAPGDLRAARESGASFYPIVPGMEAESWSRLAEEVYGLFLAGRYKGVYENTYTKCFLNSLS